jgi:hypothetical protein
MRGAAPRVPTGALQDNGILPEFVAELQDFQGAHKRYCTKLALLALRIDDLGSKAGEKEVFGVPVGLEPFKHPHPGQVIRQIFRSDAAQLNRGELVDGLSLLRVVCRLNGISVQSSEAVGRPFDPAQGGLSPACA